MRNVEIAERLSKLDATVALKATEQFFCDALSKSDATVALKATEQFVGDALSKLDATSRCFALRFKGDIQS